MRGNHVLFNEWLKRCRHQCTRRGNEPINEHGEPVPRTADGPRPRGGDLARRPVG
jgi:hypothetical protein